MKTQLTFTRDELTEAFREWNKSVEANPYNFVPLSEAVPEAQADHLIKLLNNNSIKRNSNDTNTKAN